MSEVSFRAYVMAVDRVEKRLRRVTAALEAAGIPYAVIGGNAVAAWVATVDPAATRTTKDIDLLVQKSDRNRIKEVMSDLGFGYHDLRRMVIFTDPEEPSKRSGVHLVWAEERVRPSYPCPSPAVDRIVRDAGGFWILDLPALVQMKLTSFRDIDRVHVSDLLSVGLIDDVVRRSLSADLSKRLLEIELSLEE